ncbi:MAG TPA: response regulator [Trichocoleus sp.]
MKILLVEDDLPTREVLAGTLSDHHYAVKLAADGEMGLDLARQFEYDLVLLDIVLPKMDGISLCRQLRTQGYQSPILLLTAKESATDRVIGLDAGADDYVIKPFDMEELLARIRALLRRGKSVASTVITWENLRFDSMQGEVTCNQTLIHLTPKEYCLLELFLLNPKRIFSRRAILDRLWDFADSPGEETVSTHIKCLRQKLKIAGAADPIETVHGLGYRLRSPALLETDETHTSPPAEQPDHRRKVAANTARIWDKFKHQFLDQFGVLEQASDELQASHLTAELQQQAKQMAHKLAGSLGIFGLMEGSHLARQLEDHLQTPIKDVLQSGQIVELVTQLRQELQQDPSIQTAPKPEYRPLILIVDDDLLLAERVRIEALAWGLRVEVVTDLEIARKAIEQTPPDVVLLDLTFPGSEDGLSLLQELMQRVPKIPVLAFTGRGSLTDRLAVARSGGCVFLQKPLPTHEILKSVTAVLSRTQIPHHNRVLVVDADSIATQALTTWLEPNGIEVTTLAHPHQFWETLTAQIPNLLVLELEINGLSGIELCQTVRSDPKWQHLPIVFLSSQADPADLNRAFMAGADDFILKSVPLGEQVTRLVYRLKRVGFQTPEHNLPEP